MSWLLVSWFLAFGYVPQQIEAVNGSYFVSDPTRIATVAQIGIEAQAWERLRVYTDIENFQYAPETVEDGGFIPYRVDYTFGAEIKLNKWISVTVEHECDHVVAIGGNADGYESRITKLVAKVQGSTKF